MTSLKAVASIFIVSSSFILGQSMKGDNKPLPHMFYDGTTTRPMRRDAILSGNQIRTIIWNNGSIGQPAREPSMEWPIYSAKGYAYEFGLLVGAEVVDANGDTIHIISDGLRDGGSGTGSAELSPTNEYWTWEPLPGYAREPYEENPSIALSHKPVTWSQDWTGWPGLLGEGVISADQESYWVMDDRYNAEFDYYPVPADSAIRGIGIEVACRSYQWSAPEIENALIMRYEITNVSARPLEKVVVGMFGDPHIGGSSDYADDYAWAIGHHGLSIEGNEHFFARDLIYAWDAPGSTNDCGDPWHEIGWLGFRLLDSPNNSGFQSFHALQYGTIIINNDENIWQRLTSGLPNDIIQNADNILLFGSDFFPLYPGETHTFAIAVALGYGFADMVWNSFQAQLYYHNRLQTSIDPPTIAITNPVLNHEITASYEVQWQSTGSTGQPLSLDLYYNRNDDQSWRLIATGVADEGSYFWNTSNLPDGYNTQILIIAHDSSAIGYNISDYFIINNPDSTADPEILFDPLADGILSGDVDVTWRAGDADGTPVTVHIYFSTDGGSTWQFLARDLSNTGIYTWDTRHAANGIGFQLKLAVTDGTTEVETLPSRQFEVHNEPVLVLPDSLVRHIQGNSDGSVAVHIVDSAAVTSHRYQVTFDDTSQEYTSYDVFDLDTQITVVEDATALTADMAGPLFDGLRLVIDDLPEAEIDPAQTGWVASVTNYSHVVGIWDYGTARSGFAHPRDYKIVWQADNVPSIVDTSQSGPFIIYDVTDHNNVTIAPYYLASTVANQFVLGQTKIGILSEPVLDVSKKTWEVRFYPPISDSAIAPAPGDTFAFATLKPFSSRDIFQFNTAAIMSITPYAQTNLSEMFSLHQNYPNPFNPSTWIHYEVPSSQHVRLVIYDILGREVSTLADRWHMTGSYTIGWNGRGPRGLIVASGIYFYCLQTEEGRSEIRKMVLLR